MSEESNANQILQRLKANLSLNGIQCSNVDIDGMVEKGFLSTILTFEKFAQNLQHEILPDFLKDWDLKSYKTVSASAGNSAENRNEESVNYSSSSKPLDTQKSSGEKAGPPFYSFDTIAEAAKKLKAREISPVELTRIALDQIAVKDPELNSFQLVLAERALKAAETAEKEIKAGNYKGPLHGIPVAVKDLLAMEGTITTAGSKILGNRKTDFNSDGVEKLEKAGAIIVGKTRMSEFAYSPGSNNAHYGSTRNPHNRDFDTGGSSSGSGAAVAAGLVYGALGTDTGGSIRIPSAQCGIVGLKPTYGRLSLYGGVTLSWSLDHIGPMTRTVEDALLMLNVLEGYDPRDIRTRQVPPVTVDLDEGVKGLRIGVLRDGGFDAPFASSDAIKAWKDGLSHLEQAGAKLVEVDLKYFNEMKNLNGSIIGLEAAAYHQDDLRNRLSDFGDFMRQRVLAAYAFAPTAYIQVQQIRTSIRQQFDNIMEELDLLSTPTMPGEAPQLGTPGPTTFCSPFNFLGWPAITVPVGRGEKGLPLGLQLVGKPWDEATVLQAARVVEAG